MPHIDIQESVTVSTVGHRAPLTAALGAFAVTGVAFAVVALGAWVYASQGPEMVWFYATLVTALVAFFWFAPYARTWGRPGEGTIAVWLAIFLGPLSLIGLVPWMSGLAARFEAEEDGFVDAQESLPRIE
jgi:hypothetical protein